MKKDNIYDMALHDYWQDDAMELTILRVPGGWLYLQSTRLGGLYPLSFVPYDYEFEPNDNFFDPR